MHGRQACSIVAQLGGKVPGMRGELALSPRWRQRGEAGTVNAITKTSYCYYGPTKPKEASK